MRVEVVAIGTELLLGQIADTNSQWLGEQLAAAGIESYYHQHVGDNLGRIVLALRTALARSDAVIACGGLGPTQDDITREALAEVLGVELHLDESVADQIRAMFASRGRTMPDNNLRQAQVPEGAAVIPQVRGTAPGLICRVGNKVVYALPGVPHELQEMFARGVAPDLEGRLPERGRSVIASRVLRIWGPTESGIAEALGDRLDEVEGSELTFAFLASGVEGLKVRLTVRSPDPLSAHERLDAEEARVRALLTSSFGDVVFGIDDASMERVVAQLLLERRWTLGIAESLTGGMVASRLVGVPGAATWLLGSVVSYSADVKYSILGVRTGPVITAQAAMEMASGAARVLDSHVGLSLTGVAGPDEEEGVAVGTVFIGLSLPDRAPTSTVLRLPGDRQRIRDYATISSLDVLRRALRALEPE